MSARTGAFAFRRFHPQQQRSVLEVRCVLMHCCQDELELRLQQLRRSSRSARSSAEAARGSVPEERCVLLHCCQDERAVRPQRRRRVFEERGVAPYDCDLRPASITLRHDPLTAIMYDGPLDITRRHANRASTRVQHQPSPSPVRDTGHARAWWADICFSRRRYDDQSQKQNVKQKRLGFSPLFVQIMTH